MTSIFSKQFTPCLQQFCTVAECLSTLYSSLFDGDCATLEYIALYPLAVCGVWTKGRRGCVILIFDSLKLATVMSPYGECHIFNRLFSEASLQVCL